MDRSGSSSGEQEKNKLTRFLPFSFRRPDWWFGGWSCCRSVAGCHGDCCVGGTPGLEEEVISSMFG